MNFLIVTGKTDDVSDWLTKSAGSRASTEILYQDRTQSKVKAGYADEALRAAQAINARFLGLETEVVEETNFMRWGLLGGAALGVWLWRRRRRKRQ